MAAIDFNCDMGEGMGNDEKIMPFITSVNIACGYHAGTKATMKKTVKLAIKHGVAIGAHPSFKDKKNFGRVDFTLSNADVYDIVLKQVNMLNEIANAEGAELHHVKPHGALYNMAARTPKLAAVIALAVKDAGENLYLYGTRYLITEAKKLGLKTVSEVFADRTYNNDGSLTSRRHKGALIEDTKAAVKHVLQMVKKGTVATVQKSEIPVLAQTLCIHSDTEYAVELAEAIYSALKKQKIEIKAV